MQREYYREPQRVELHCDSVLIMSDKAVCFKGHNIYRLANGTNIFILSLKIIGFYYYVRERYTQNFSNDTYMLDAERDSL